MVCRRSAASSRRGARRFRRNRGSGLCGAHPGWPRRGPPGGTGPGTAHRRRGSRAAPSRRPPGSWRCRMLATLRPCRHGPAGLPAGTGRTVSLPPANHMSQSHHLPADSHSWWVTIDLVPVPLVGLRCFVFEQRADDRDRTRAVAKDLAAGQRKRRVRRVVAGEFEQSKVRHAVDDPCRPAHQPGSTARARNKQEATSDPDKRSRSSCCPNHALRQRITAPHVYGRRLTAFAPSFDPQRNSVPSARPA
jgi:hypothetical protein